MEKINRICGEEMEGNIVIGGDFNVRELGGTEWLGYGERYNKDKIVGNGGINLVG